jgi:peptide/nickel transport system substrate-binding protein
VSPPPPAPSRPPRRWRAMTAATAAALLLGGCFAGPGDTGGTVLRVAYPFPPQHAYTPYGQDGTILSRLGVSESLTRLDADGSPVPSLATRWQRLDAATWRFELRTGAVFHDGTRVTADAVARALASAAAASPVPAELRSVRLTVRVAGPTRFDVVTSAPDPVLPQRLSSPSLPILAPAAYATGGRVDPVGHGSGPFELTRTRGTDGATLAAFGDHWDGAPRLDGLEVRYIPDATARTAALVGGEVDLVHTVPVAQADRLGDRLVEIPLPRTVSVYLNARRPALADPGARAAVAGALDTRLLARSVFEGRADPARALFGPASPWAERRPPLPRRPEATRPSGTVRIATYAERPELPEVADALAAALRGRGVTVEQDVRAYAALEPDLLAGAFDIVVASRSYLVDTGEPTSYLESDYTCDGSYNLARLCDPAVDGAVRALAGIEDVATRRQAALRAEHAVLATGGVVPVVHERARLGLAPAVTGVAEDPYERLLVTGDTAVG